MSLLLWASGCELIDPDDCRYFQSGCQPYEPPGLICGMAHSTAGHQGSYCREGYDPAAGEGPERLEEIEEGAASPCPEGYSLQSMGDHERSPEGQWYFCVASGNLSSSSGELRDVPAGATCGLSRFSDGDEVPCDGADPTRGRCPAGYELRWIVERFTDCLDEDYYPVCPEGTSAPECEDFECLPQDPRIVYGFEVIPFCEVVDGCAEGECPDFVDLSGLLCGLHVRDSRLGDGHPEEIALLDLQSEVLDAFLTPKEATGAHPWLSEALPFLEESAGRRPSCMGRDVEREGCPEGLSLLCTADYFKESAVNHESICWCAPEGDTLRL